MRDITITPELGRIANSPFAELDAVIEYLTEARASRARARATVAFKSGDQLVFQWPTSKGPRMLVGDFVAPDEQGKVRVTNVKPLNPESGLGLSCGNYIVDAAKVDKVHHDGDEDTP